jgi:DnaJ-class molecular chaperone
MLKTDKVNITFGQLREICSSYEMSLIENISLQNDCNLGKCETCNGTGTCPIARPMFETKCCACKGTGKKK